MRIALLVAGRGAPGTNAVLYAFLKLALAEGHEVFGFKGGFKGLVEGKWAELKEVPEDLPKRGAPFLPSGVEPRFKKLEFREKAYRNLKEVGAEALVLLGGNGTMSAGVLIAEETGMPVIGVPCSAEGDVGGTEFCVGFESFTACAVSFTDGILERAKGAGGLFLVRLPSERGYAPLRVALSCAADALLVPEERPLREKVLQLAKERLEEKGYFLAVSCEGYGGLKELIQLLEEKVGKVEVAEPGEALRGAPPVHSDRVAGAKLGEVAYESLLAGERSGFVAYEKGKFFVEDFEKASSPPPIDREALKLFKRLSS